MKNSSYYIYKNIIIADALSTPFENMSKGHINSNFKELDDFTDTLPAIKDNLSKWRKPNLYSSLTQLLFILTASLKNRNIDLTEFKKHFKNLPDIQNSEFSIFRHPSLLEKKIINTAINEISDNIKLDCSRIIPITTPFILLKGNLSDICLIAIEFLNNFGAEVNTISGSIIYISILKEIIDNNLSSSTNIINLSIKSSENLLEILKSIPNKIDDLEKAEIEICSNANKYLKNPISRANINNPLLILPFAIFICEFPSCDIKSLSFTTSKLGGSTVSLSTITSAISAALHKNNAINDDLFDSLTNKKKITLILESIKTKGISSKIIKEFVKSESSLTSKEIEELNAKLKNSKQNSIKNSKKNSKYDFSTPVKESWNKKDKAKWKKEKQKQNFQQDNEDDCDFS